MKQSRRVRQRANTGFSCQTVDGSVWFCVVLCGREPSLCLTGLRPARRSAETGMIFLFPSGRRKQTVLLFHGSTSVSVFPVTSCFGSDLATSSREALSRLRAPLALQRAIVKLKPPIERSSRRSDGSRRASKLHLLHRWEAKLDQYGKKKRTQIKTQITQNAIKGSAFSQQMGTN